MYSQEDMRAADRRIARILRVWIPALALLLAAFVAALALRIRPLAYIAPALLAITACFGLIFYLLPNLGYRQFLLDMQAGLAREMEGRIVSIAPDSQAELHDGARVVPVHLFLTREQDERIVWLNVSKRALFPPEGAEVRLRLYGRHIREVEAIERIDT